MEKSRSRVSMEIVEELRQRHFRFVQYEVIDITETCRVVCKERTTGHHFDPKPLAAVDELTG